ncbi:MAG: RDD family protein, partial [Bacteroidota bacterium]
MARTTDITTVQNVTIEYQLATVGDRILAFLLDSAIITVGAVLLLQLARPLMEADNSWAVFFVMLVILLFFLYHL